MRTIIPGEAPRGRFGAVWDLGGGGGGTNTTVSKTDSAPWATQQPYLQTGFETAKGLLAGGGPQPYPNATYVPMSGPTTQALNAGEGAANAQWGATDQNTLSNLTPNAMNQTLSMARGDQLTNVNPFFQQMLTNTFQRAQPTIASAFAGGGRGISGASDAATADAWANTAGQLGYQDYGRERANQIAAINASPGMAQAGMAPLQQLGQIGQAREGYAGQELQDTLKRYDATQNAPWANLGKYMSTVGGGNYGSSQTQMVPTTANPWLTGLGAAGAGANILRTLSDMWK